MATIRDVAKKSGFSISTVSLALSGEGPVSEITREKIWNAATSIGYVANPIAQSLARGRTKLIGMVVGDVGNPFVAGVLKTVERKALDNGHLVIVSDSDTDADRELEILSHLSNLRVSGIILTPHGYSEHYIDVLKKLEMPIVLLDHRLEGFDADYVSSDNKLAGAMITEHLIRLGHKRIVHIAGTRGSWTAEQRKMGYRSTMAAAGLTVEDGFIHDGEYSGERTYEITMRLLTEANPPTAIIAANNVMGLGALQAIQDLGIPCPDEISLATVDDVPWGEVIHPRLTMAVQPMEKIARWATDFLLDRIKERKGPKKPPREKIFIPKLVTGKSCRRIG